MTAALAIEPSRLKAEALLCLRILTNRGLERPEETEGAVKVKDDVEPE